MPTNIDDIIELLSKVRTESGAIAQTPPSAEEPPAAAAGDSNVEPAVVDPAQVQNELLETMSAVLAARRDLSVAVDASRLANQTLHNATEATQKGWVPKTDESTVVDEAYTEQERLFFVRAQKRADARRAERDKVQALWTHWLAGVALREAIEKAQAIPGLAQGDVLLAAQDLNSRSSFGDEGEEPEPQLEPPDLTEEQQDSVNSARKAAREATFALSRALRLTDIMTSAASAVQKARKVKVVPPVRPTEEEIQRYLRQLEQAQIDRQKAEQTLFPLLSAKAALLEEVGRCETGLTAEREVLTSLDWDHHMDVMPHKWLADKVDSHFYFVKDQLGRAGSGNDNLDGLRKPAQNKTDLRRLAEVRKHLRSLAIALAHFNEAKSSYEVISDSPKAGKVGLRDITTSTASWKDAAEWRRTKAVQQADNDRLDRSRQARLELLEKSVAKFLRDVGDAEDTLSRYLNLIEPHPERPDCDEMRMLRRAALRAVADAEAVKPPKPEPDDGD